MQYSLVNNITGEEITLKLDPADVAESAWFWKLLGWSVFPW